MILVHSVLHMSAKGLGGVSIDQDKRPTRQLELGLMSDNCHPVCCSVHWDGTGIGLVSKELHLEVSGDTACPPDTVHHP